MRARLMTFIGCSLAAAALAGSVSGGLLYAQAAKSAAPAAKAAAKTPDLTGVYNVATITPLERAAMAKPVLTDAEAAAIENYEAQRVEKDAAPSKADREAPPVGGEKPATPPKTFLETIEAFAGGGTGGYNRFWLSSGSKVITVNGEKRSSIVVDPPNGRVPAMKPEARKRNAALLAITVAPDANEATASAGPAGAFDGPELRPLAERCLLGFGSTSGPPTLPNYFYNNLKQIVQTPDSIMILNEMVHDARVIRMNATHLPSHIKRWMGDSIGRWEGDTLVVDTTNFTAKTQFQGSGEKLHVVERFTRVDANTLLYRFTVDDPDTWDRPWTGEYPWVGTQEPLYEYACHEGNYALGGILRGARLAETEKAAKKP